MIHFEGEKDAERLVRMVDYGGCVYHHEGKKGAERLVRVVWPNGDVLYFEGKMGAQPLVHVASLGLWLWFEVSLWLWLAVGVELGLGLISVWLDWCQVATDERMRPLVRMLLRYHVPTLASILRARGFHLWPQALRFHFASAVAVGPIFGAIFGEHITVAE